MLHKLRLLRKSRGISQTFISEKLGYSHPSGYSNIENGRVKLRFDQAQIIANILGVSIEELQEDSENYLAS